MALSWDIVKDFIISFGWAKGVFTIFFFLAHFWIYRLYMNRINDRKEEIDRLAQDNREYRNLFLSILDKNLDYKKRR